MDDTLLTLRMQSMVETQIFSKPLLLSLFCGIGGLDIGFERSKYEVGLAFDIRQSSIDSYNRNRTAKNGHVIDVRDITIEKLDNLFGSEFRPIGIIGGPPCQGFSVSNVHQDINDERNSLSFSYANLLKKLNDRSPVHFFVFENVKGLIGSKHSSTFEKIKSGFREAGFNLFPFVLNSKNFGIPQSRERLIMIGLNRKLYRNVDISLPLKLDGYEKEPITVKMAIGGLPEPVHFADVSSNKAAISYHPNHWCMTPKSAKFRNEGTLVPGGGFGRSFRTLIWDKPSPTVAYGNREVHVHPSGKRRLSVYEAMVLQGFGRDYVLEGNLSQQFTQVSEAVPPPLSEVIARSITAKLHLG
ncbi:MAG: DNA cytosine methyltransferase [Imperialibacter sp.]|uniref:DNA cytosine methyltransferase n=1 Tax=Imperialibacter sp. TaxID=2038411 RepID=UPI003A89628E